VVHVVSHVLVAFQNTVLLTTGSAVWHQADPITKGTRWALVIFYKVDYE
jgi:hypothetical protein